MKKSKPVILKLEGGLGNQLFQLVSGYFVAAKLKLELHIDQYSIPLTTAHGETSSGFEPFETLSLPNSKRVILLPSLPSKLMVILAKRNIILKRFALKVRLFSSNPYNLKLFLESNDAQSASKIFEIDKPLKLHGNFQSWKIVERAAQFGFPRILRLRNTPQWIVSLEESIDFKNSLVLHFRVGDDARANYNFKQPTINYYLEALKLVNLKRDIHSTYILSDDIARVKDIFGIKVSEEAHYLEMPDGSSPAERLYVLSSFGGIVCANSTFCGWAA